MWYGWVLVQTNCHRGIDQHPAEEPGLGVRSIRKTAQIKEIKNMDKKQKILIVDDAFRYATTTFSSFTHEPEVVKF